MSVRKPADGSGALSEAARTTSRKRHQLTLKARESLGIDGVVGVESFDDQELVVETDQGVLLIRGEGLHIRELNLESGTLHADGLVRVMEYAGDSLGKRGKGLLAKLFK
ncbi:MAG TPA: sporulation protein YabP [Firmicutes bacterium]|jgi:sporulation protein YabP|nr:sporulation protein YabP [Bacillota bacterium]